MQIRGMQHCWHHPRSSGVYSPSSRHFFLCFSGFLRLSGTTFVAAGAAAALRASRRASLPLSSRFFFFRIPFIPPPSLHPTAIGTRLTSASCAPRNRINQALRLAVLDPRIRISVAFPPLVRNKYRYSHSSVIYILIFSSAHTRHCARASRPSSGAYLKTKLFVPQVPKCFILCSYKNSPG
jgi:hypothetical protein